MDYDVFREGVKAIAESAATLNGWSLAILGGTVVGIVGSEYLRPAGFVRYFYLLFLPGWFSLGYSIYHGDKIARRATAAAFTGDETMLMNIASAMNAEFVSQRLGFHWALAIFGCWLVSLLLWWVFADRERLLNEK